MPDDSAGPDGGTRSILRRWLQPSTSGDAATQAEAASLRAEYDRIFALMGRTEFERVLSQRHADAATAYAHEALAETNQLRAELEAMTAARAEAEALARQHHAHAEAHLAARRKAEAEAAAAGADAAAQTSARRAAEAAAAATHGEAEAQAGFRLAADAKAAAFRAEAAAQASARLAAEADAATAKARADRSIAGLRAEVALLSAARNAAEKARNLAQEAAMSQHGELIRLRAETGIMPEAPPLLGPKAPPPQPMPPIPFDEDWYLETYGDVKAAVSAEIFPSGRDHYLQHGRAEGRQSLPQQAKRG